MSLTPRTDAAEAEARATTMENTNFEGAIADAASIVAYESRRIELELGAARQDISESVDMADVGRAFMAKLPKDYCWSQCPTEYVTRLGDDLDEAREVASWWQKLGEDMTGRHFLPPADLLPLAETAWREKEAYAEALTAPARELLYLYDWRPELAEAEKNPTTDPKWLKRMLREYGERKKAGWIALRAALNRESEIVHCSTCNGLGELPPRSSDPEDATPAPPCPDCQQGHAVGHPRLLDELLDAESLLNSGMKESAKEAVRRAIELCHSQYSALAENLQILHDAILTGETENYVASPRCRIVIELLRSHAQGTGIEGPKA